MSISLPLLVFPFLSLRLATMEKTSLGDIESVERNADDLLDPSNKTVSKSDQRLRELGYKSEFRRDMSLFGVLGISFCAIGILTGMSSAFQTGLFSGGPLGLFWGWNVRTSCSVSESLSRVVLHVIF